MTIGYRTVCMLLFFLFICALPQKAECQGYDENTEITFTGVLRDVHVPGKGPVILKVAFGSRMYAVQTGPFWYFEKEHIRFEPGAQLEITGSRSYQDDGALYVIARRIRDLKYDRDIVLRDSDFRPVWRGMR